MMKKLRCALAIGILVCIGFSFLPHVGRAQTKSPHTIHPTADIHPSVIRGGRVTVGAYKKIGAGTVPTGNVTIGRKGDGA